MKNEEKLLGYMQEAVSYLLKRDSFESGDTFKPTQKEALEAYDIFLNDNARSAHSRLKGYFEIPTGIGKTAIFVGIVGAAHKIAKAKGEELKTIIVAPRNNLLTQALDDFKRFAPDTENQIGLYGDGHKDLSKPITIMTYPAWIELSRQGKIGSHNTHILVSDEGHRGTSENRVTNISEVFNGATVRIAFTATAHFERTDELNGSDKSVKNSHGHEIYYKPLQDAIRSGELAAYMQCRGLTIRVEPYGDTKNPNGEFKQQLKQSAWNKRVVKLYAEGRDNRTGDLLSDNQAAFFVDGIAHAEKLEKLLNADPQLSSRAIEKGCEGVAVAIHSLMPKKERDRKFEDYKAGKYMAAIGADMFKEGFSHRPLKTIFDYPRTSRVDKLQILGRGLRKWYNPQKEGRDEGLTFVEPLIYIGSDDPEIDRQREETAKRNTISVRDILGSMVILSPAEAGQTRNRNTNNRDDNPYVFVNDDNVKEYVTEEDLFELSSEIERLQKGDHIEITDEMHAELIMHTKRTTVGSTALLQYEGAPRDLTHQHIEGIKYQTVKNTHKDNWNWIIQTYKSIEDKIKIKITEEMRLNIKSEFNRIGIGPRKLLNTIDAPKNLNHSNVKNWVTGGAKVAEKDHWDWVIKECKKYPARDERIVITDKLHKKLTSEMQRINKTPRALYKEFNNAPEGLTHSIIEKAIAGKLKTISKKHWNSLLETFKGIQDAKSTVVTQITNEMRKELYDETSRVGIGAKSILKNSPYSELTLSMLNGWRNGAIKTAKKDHWDWAINYCKSLPDKSPIIVITEKMRENLASKMEETGIKNMKILNFGNPPEELKSSTIKNWINGSAKTAIKDHWDWVIDTYSLILERKKDLSNNP